MCNDNMTMCANACDISIPCLFENVLIMRKYFKLFKFLLFNACFRFNYVFGIDGVTKIIKIVHVHGPMLVEDLNLGRAAPTRAETLGQHLRPKN